MVLRSKSLLLAITLSALAIANAGAEPPSAKPAKVKTHQHKAHQHISSPSTKGYEAVMQTMHAHMDAPLSGNADVDFVRQMIPHHQAAVDMAKIQLRYGQDERLKKFTRWVIQAQEQEIGFMNQWLRRRDNGAVVKDAKDYYGDAMSTMHEGMMIDYTGDADLDFVRGMMPHHQGAVDMAGILIADGNDPELNKLANDIYRSQSAEIAWMQDWLAEHRRN